MTLCSPYNTPENEGRKYDSGYQTALYITDPYQPTMDDFRTFLL